MDYLNIGWRLGKTKKAAPEIYPWFSVKKKKDLMIRGNDFYAIWDEENKRWSTDEDRAIKLMDEELKQYRKEWCDDHPNMNPVVLYFENSDTGSIDKWHKYCQKQMRDNFHPLDEVLVFANTEVSRENYSSKQLDYALQEGDYSAWDELVGTLYSPAERHKIEWAIGSVVSGDSKTIQKFVVFYGATGTGKSTILNIIQQLFKGYYCTFSSKALGSKSDRFALEAFKNNPLIGIEHDGDLSRIEDNTRLNSLVSHEEMIVDQKYAGLYPMQFNTMLFMGTNRPVKITDSKSGILRRLIDIHPTEEKIPLKRYQYLMDRIKFELGAIAWHCMEVYEENPSYYDDYIPQNMLGATNDFYNFMEEYALEFKKKDMTTLKYAWAEYKRYCQEASVPFPYSRMVFKEELKTYFREFKPRGGPKEKRLWNVYEGFKWQRFRDLFEDDEVEVKDIPDEEAASAEGFDNWIKLEFGHSGTDPFMGVCGDCPAQYATADETPKYKWVNVKTTLRDIDQYELHYVKVPENLIVIDFDIRDPETGEKSLELNLKAASAFPKTYAETSKSGKGIHLHYFYDGDVSKLSSVYDDHVEVKVFTGGSSLRRKLTLCNDIPIGTLNSGLPLKEESKVVNFDGVKSEKALRTSIMRNLRKEIHADTRSSIDFIYKILNDAYDSGMTYDVRNMHQDILTFAARSSHQSSYCVKLVGQMKFCSKDIEEGELEAQQEAESVYDEIVIFDCEVMPNRNGYCYARLGHPVVKVPDPTPEDVEELCKYKLIGFNNRRYDNHILYAKMMDYDARDIFKLSQRIISSEGKRNDAFFRDAYGLSYSDIYDFASTKQSLKKWEIQLGLHHQENEIPWDKEVTDQEWTQIMDYCANDVVATMALFEHLKPDWNARLMLAEVSGLTPNDTTNQHTTKIIIGDDPHPQSQFVYTDLSEMFPGYEFDERGIDKGRYLEGTKIVSGKSIFMGEDPGEGGYVYAEPGIYENVALLDIASMHPSSIIALNLFGDYYTKRFADLVKIRLLIKHGQFEEAAKLFDGKLAGYLTDKAQAKQLSQALKIAINSVYGLTSAKFDNKFRDPRNVDNIVAKRGALFMILLKNELQKLGYTVAHIKTDSIKIPNATPEVIQFVMDFGKQYGYTFEHEATYEKMCLVNDAVYIAKYADGAHEFELPTGEKILTPWTATGTQFQISYVFKRLFADAPITFRDMCETKTVSTALYLDFNENLGENEHNYVFVGRAGLFCPMKDGAGGGLLLREKDGKYSAATGTKGYRWMESEVVKATGKEDQIDRRYYAALVDEAKATISEYGDFEAFAS